MLQFPKGFFWGSATSATQSEGSVEGDGKGQNIWDLWFDLEPYKFHGQVGPQNTTTMYSNYINDIELLKQTGHNSFRTSISWARMFPNGYGEVNEQAVTFYKDYFTRLRNEGIEPFVNLYHFDMPVCLQEIGGWENLEVVHHYEAFASTCFELFGDVVKYWITFNEPIVHVECGYLNTFHYPMEVDPKKAVQVGYYTQLASALAIQSYKKTQDGKIGIVLNLTPAYARSKNPADQDASRIAELFANKSFLDPSVHGEYPQELIEILKEHDLLPVYTQEELDIIKNNTVDYLGVNYYQPMRVQAKECMPNPKAPVTPHSFFDAYVMPGRKMNPHRGWEIYEQGIYDIAMNIKTNYNNIPWLITENGMGVEGELKFKENGMIQDDYRIAFYEDHLRYLHKGIEEGSNCFGYQVWTFIDCWSWLNSYKNRYGFVELDLETQKRTIKKSGLWFKQVSENNGF